MLNTTDSHARFPVTRNRIFFDHARVAPLPQCVRDAIHEFTQDACEHGNAHYLDWMAGVAQTRNRFAKLINARLDEVAFVKNTSEGISIVANGLDWKPGDNVVIPDIEFPANVYPWQNLKRHGVETRFVRAVEGRVLFDDIVAQTDSRTRIISISSVECNSGFRNDLHRIGMFCKESGILFCVDAIQSLGILPMDVKRDGIDFLSADGHKWLLGLEGLGGFYISKEALERVYPVTVGWGSVVDSQNFMHYDFTFRPDAQRFEEGSANTLSIHALGAALELFEQEGIERIEKRIMELGDIAIRHLQKRDIKIASSTIPEERSGIISFVPDVDLNPLLKFMMSHSVSMTARDGLARISPHFYNSEDEIDHFFDLLDRFKA
ncbi:MAG: aminotransferase class V-fold PLP-dependent enzyme [Candidatus Nitrohelix vancouverensis]|uniref:Aminotransferase class V-fold PLP-dependent enzyme n=1 Tax=Candidatus Nitrohelix vancouverensis TaxID=2705534 RepID=A0A7T0G276_9BACT|nr:MAG: aminotransferase class V-fold PLP-dependent enzyme [Candidatus Nitrohelix vancouverensis]